MKHLLTHWLKELNSILLAVQSQKQTLFVVVVVVAAAVDVVVAAAVVVVCEVVQATAFESLKAPEIEKNVILNTS